jgi:hypothetical protein
MKFAKLKSPLVSFAGDALKDQDGKVLSAGDVLLIAFSQPPKEKEDVLSPEDNAAHYKLGLKIASANEDTEFTPEEAVLMKKKVCKLGYAPIVAGQLVDILDGN